MTFTFVEYKLPDEDEWYKGKCLNIEPKTTQNGDALNWSFELYDTGDRDLDGQKFTGMTSAKPSAKSKCGKFIMALMKMSKDDAKSGKKVEPEDLVGECCMVTFAHKESRDGGQFANVVNAKALKGSAAKKAEKKAAPAPKPVVDEELPDIPDDDSDDIPF